MHENVNLIWRCGSWTMDLSKRPLIMGILNVTPDSFSDGYPDPADALARARQLIADGADIVDIGGESTRPGSKSISTQQELDRIAPITERMLREFDIPLSIDTQKAAVASWATEQGVSIINHVSGSLDLEAMLPTLENNDAGYIGMHMRARPDVMQQRTNYINLLDTILEDLTTMFESLEKADVAPERILFDPGIGFGKTMQQCVTLLTNSQALFRSLKRPLLMGLSRKRWLTSLLQLGPGQRDAATASASALLPWPAVAIHRVHNVELVRHALILKGEIENLGWNWKEKVY